MGRILLFAAAALLLATAFIHAAGQPMVARWVEGLSHQQKAGICLVWVAVALDWAVVAALWALTAWKQARALLAAAALAAIIPLGMGLGVMRIEPAFFGGWMLLGSVALAIAGLVLMRRRAGA